MAARSAGGIVFFTVPADDHPDVYFARYQCGRWRGLNRWRGWILERRRSKRPYLAAGDGRRIPVQIVHQEAAA